MDGIFAPMFAELVYVDVDNWLWIHKDILYMMNLAAKSGPGIGHQLYGGRWNPLVIGTKIRDYSRIELPPVDRIIAKLDRKKPSPKLKMMDGRILVIEQGQFAYIELHIRDELGYLMLNDQHEELILIQWKDGDIHSLCQLKDHEEIQSDSNYKSSKKVKGIKHYVSCHILVDEDNRLYLVESPKVASPIHIDGDIRIINGNIITLMDGRVFRIHINHHKLECELTEISSVDGTVDAIGKWDGEDRCQCYFLDSEGFVWRRRRESVIKMEGIYPQDSKFVAFVSYGQLLVLRMHSHDIYLVDSVGRVTRIDLLRGCHHIIDIPSPAKIPVVNYREMTTKSARIR